MMIMNKILAAAVAVSLHAASLQAADFYVGAGLAGDGEAGSFRHNLERLSDDSGGAWKLFAGWRLGRHLALEASRHDFGTQRCCDQIADLGFTSAVEAFSAAALGRWPVGRLALFAKAGVLSWKEDGELVTLSGVTPRSADGTDLLVGAGLEVDLPIHLAVRAEWERYEFGDAASDSLWASLLYRF